MILLVNFAIRRALAGIGLIQTSLVTNISAIRIYYIFITRIFLFFLCNCSVTIVARECSILIQAPDLAFVVTKVTQFASNPAERHMAALKQILRYVKGAVNTRHVIAGEGPHVTAYFDASRSSRQPKEQSFYCSTSLDLQICLSSFCI